jgi:hypothetical protein
MAPIRDDGFDFGDHGSNEERWRKHHGAVFKASFAKVHFPKAQRAAPSLMAICRGID